MSYAEDRFGIPRTVFDPYLLFERNGRKWYILHGSSVLGAASRLKVSQVGIRAFRRVGRFVKPSTRLIQIFGHHATKGIVPMDALEIQVLLENGWTETDLHMDTGYVILALEGGHILGLGFYKDGRIRSQLPRKQLREVNFCVMGEFSEAQTGLRSFT